MTNPWNTDDIREWLNNSGWHEERLRDSFVLAIEALGLQEEYREEALSEVRAILGINR